MAPTVTVYWRPGCPFCIRLHRSLRRAGLEADEVNIWEDPDAAALFRSVARGNETVPTVVIGDLAMVNPSPTRVLEAARAAGVELPEPRPPWWRRRGWRTRRS